MQYLTIAAALSGLLATGFAAPAPASSATDDYSWSVTKWQFGRGEDAYDYSFSVTGPKDGKNPAFAATCTGTNTGGYAECSLLPAAVGGHPLIPTISANVNIVTDPNNPDDTIPRVFVREAYTDKKGCSYTYTGHHDKTGFNQPVGGAKGSKFPIIPSQATAVC